MKDKTKVLFVCIHNSARSKMAEAFLNELAGDRFEAESAGITPGKLNPVVAIVMLEEGIDISGSHTNDVFDFYKEGRLYKYVITVCDKEIAESCPIFPGITERISWTFPDPSSFEGSYEQKLEFTRKVRDEIKSAILKFANETIDY